MAATTAQQADALNSIATTSTPRHVFDLPQELQDIIFKYAYTKREEVKLVVDPSQQPKTYFPTPADLDPGRATRSPRLKVNECLVSKKWFVAAARAYVGKPSHHCGDRGTSNRISERRLARVRHQLLHDCTPFELLPPSVVSSTTPFGTTTQSLRWLADKKRDESRSSFR